MFVEEGLVTVYLDHNVIGGWFRTVWPKTVGPSYLSISKNYSCNKYTYILSMISLQTLWKEKGRDSTTCALMFIKPPQTQWRLKLNYSTDKTTHTHTSAPRRPHNRSYSGLRGPSNNGEGNLFFIRTRSGKTVSWEVFFTQGRSFIL